MTLAGAPVHTADTDPAWWRHAVIYQIYPRSFADGNGDGIGDLPGITARLPYLRDLGVDAVWLSPFYTSPQADAGYDVADYRDVDPLFGTLADADALIARAHELGLKVIVDLVPNHSSDEHAWFQAALAAGPGSPERARYLFRDGQGEHGELPPNNWDSRLRRPGVDPHHRPRRHPGPVVPAPVRPQAARPRLDQPRGPGRVRGRPAVLARPRRRRLPGRRRARPGQGGRPARLGRVPGAARQHRRSDGATEPRTASAPRCGTRTACTRSTEQLAHDPHVVQPGRRRHDPQADRILVRRGVGHPAGARGPLRARRPRCTRRSTSTSCSRRGSRRSSARSSSPPSRPTTRSAPRPRGCCPTTTSCATPRASACRSAPAAPTASASATRSRTPSWACGGPAPRPR